jgi:hypothetical protein
MNTNQNRWNNGQKVTEATSINTVPVLGGGLMKVDDLIGKTIQKYTGSIPVGGQVIITPENLIFQVASIAKSRLSVQIIT